MRFERELRLDNTSQWRGLIFPHYSSKSAQIQLFHTWPDFPKQQFEDLSAAGFSIGVKHYKHKCMFITPKKTLSRNQTKI